MPSHVTDRPEIPDMQDAWALLIKLDRRDYSQSIWDNRGTTNMTAPLRLTCHCGAAELTVTLANGLSDARRCDCSFCRRRAAANVTVADGDLEVVRGETLKLYQFGTMRAEHYFCGTCGCYTHHRRSSATSEFGVNVGGLDGVNPAVLEPLPWLDGVNYWPETAS